VTVIDPEEVNLKVMQRLLDLSGISPLYLNLVHYNGPDMIATLGREFDAVLVLDRCATDKPWPLRNGRRSCAHRWERPLRWINSKCRLNASGGIKEITTCQK
jgi:hypothetical protein